MNQHRYIFFTALLAIALLFAQHTYAHGTAPKATTLDSTHNRFSYDTTVSICNSAYSQGIKAIGKDVGMVYLGLTKRDSIAIVDTGKGEIIIQDIYTNDPDATWILGAIAHNWTFPDTLQPGDTLWLDFTFAPTNSTISGKRHYQVKYTVVNSTGDTVYATVGGTGVTVDMYTHIDQTYTCYLDSTVVVSLMVDSINDPIGNANIHGYVAEMYHYGALVTQLVKAYNIGTDKTGSNGLGQIGTLSEGALVVDNVVDDSIHTYGDQGYYELITTGIPNQIESIGTLIKFKFLGIALDTSWLRYAILAAYDNQGNPLSYVQTHSSPGLITVIPPPKFSYAVYPNPFDQSAAIHFSISLPTHAKLTIYNSIGQVVGTIIDRDLSPGDYTTNFTGAGLPNGMYFYTLATSGNGSYHGSMELLR